MNANPSLHPPHTWPTPCDLSMESLHEEGRRAGVWRLLVLFAEPGLPRTAFAVGRALELQPRIGRVLGRMRRSAYVLGRRSILNEQRRRRSWTSGRRSLRGRDDRNNHSKAETRWPRRPHTAEGMSSRSTRSHARSVPTPARWRISACYGGFTRHSESSRFSDACTRVGGRRGARKLIQSSGQIFRPQGSTFGVPVEAVIRSLQAVTSGSPRPCSGHG